MKSMRACLSRLAMAGVCLSWAGCGGGDVPDPDSDSRAASNEPAKPRGRQAQAEPEPVAVASNDAPKSEPAEPEKPAPAAPKGDSSGTDEMLKSPAPGNTPEPSPAPAQPQSPSPAPAPTPAPTPNQTPNGPAAPMPSPQPMSPNGGGPGGKAPGDGETPTPPGGENDRRRPGNRGNGGPGEPGPGGPGPSGPAPGGRGPGGAGPQGFGLADESGMAGGGAGGGIVGGPNGSNGPTDFHTPANAVTAFLNALKSKNKDKLTEATARRAPTESIEKHQKIFSEIVDGSISDDDLAEIAKSFDGFQVMYVLNAKSTGRIGVVVGKNTTGGGHLQRTVMTRKEKEGWKVLDIEELFDFKALPNFGRRGKTKTK